MSRIATVWLRIATNYRVPREVLVSNGTGIYIFWSQIGVKGRKRRMEE